ncbi:hypothetical protein WN944_013054 [Citrus x changshan-huyou]|uniref:Uncharacterized protein n=1 Tax=Citrus x changshan-huyou TaxID=2935761 RepID=A0AAP0QJD7_9ROSI
MARKRCGVDHRSLLSVRFLPNCEPWDPQKLFSQAIELSKTFYGYSDDEKKLFNSSLRSGAPLRAGYSRSWDFMAALHYFPATECENNGIIVSTLCSKMMLEAFELTNMFTQEYGGFLYKDYQAL